jgi:hypothetical protein
VGMELRGMTTVAVIMVSGSASPPPPPPLQPAAPTTLASTLASTAASALPPTHASAHATAPPPAGGVYPMFNVKNKSKVSIGGSCTAGCGGASCNKSTEEPEGNWETSNPMKLPHRRRLLSKRMASDVEQPPRTQLLPTQPLPTQPPSIQPPPTKTPPQAQHGSHPVLGSCKTPEDASSLSSAIEVGECCLQLADEQLADAGVRSENICHVQ